MARAIERIERDITALQEAIRAIAVELQNTYTSYFHTLGQAVRKQLILASYHLCTQGHPENFLKLSLNQRQQLQQSLRKLGQQTAERLLTFIGSGEPEVAASAETETEAGENDSNANHQNQHNSPAFDPANPIELSQWQQELDQASQEALKRVSHDANVLLQKAGILPKKIPEPILAAAAAAAEAAAEVVPGPPNLLNLVIEMENEQESEDSSLTQIMAVNLRLGEIEFADAALLSERKQIRNILVQLNKLGREYQKKHRELKIAEAEAAWRASWFED
jgi:hypothetical protein